VQQATLSAPWLTRLANSAWSLSQRYWRIVVVAMLALLHVAVFRGVADPWARAMLLAHLGLLLLWQPFLRAEQRVSATQGVILLLVAAGVMFRLDWWLLAFWVVVIAGLVGGKVYQHDAKWQRRCYLVMLAYLLALLAIVILPEIAPQREIAPEIRRGAEFVLPLAFVLIALFPAEPQSAEAAHIIVRRLLANALGGETVRPGMPAFSFSAGISTFPELSTDSGRLRRQADAALYWSKRHGRTDVQVFDPERHGAADDTRSTPELAAAVAHVAQEHLLAAVFQPIYDLKTGRPVGFEGLVRPAEATE